MILLKQYILWCGAVGLRVSLSLVFYASKAKMLSNLCKKLKKFSTRAQLNGTHSQCIKTNFKWFQINTYTHQFWSSFHRLYHNFVFWIYFFLSVFFLLNMQFVCICVLCWGSIFIFGCRFSVINYSHGFLSTWEDNRHKKCGKTECEAVNLAN